MSLWFVKIEGDLIPEIAHWSENEQLELLAIQQRLERGGPEEMGLIKSELEGVPAWHDLSSPISLRMPVDTQHGWSVLMLEIQPNFRIVIVRLE